MLSSIDLSIIVPAFNEAQRLPTTLETMAAYFAARPERRVEILVVDDGSEDGTATLPWPKASAIAWQRLRNERNRGKGFSVRRGMLAAQGERRLFTDADLSAPIEEITKLDAALDRGADVAIGSRRERRLIGTHQSVWRENAGRVFNKIVRVGLGLPFVDTQCGFKLFTRACAEAVFPQQQIEGWGFDPELLFLARRQNFRIEEVPVVWSHAEGAKIRLVGDSMRMFEDVLRIRRLHR